MTTSVYHFLTMLHFSPQPQDDLGPSALDTKTPVTTKDDSGALNLDPYNLQAMFETCGIKPCLKASLFNNDTCFVAVLVKS